MKKTMIVPVIAVACGLFGTQEANAIALNFLEPSFWNLGDPNSTYQEWNAEESAFLLGGIAPFSSDVNPSLTESSMMGASGATVAGSGGYYSSTNDYDVHADIINHGGSSGSGGPYPSSYGTRVIIQTAASLNDPHGVFPDSMQIVQPDGSPIVGGENGDALFIGDISSDLLFFFSFGIFPVQEQIFEFWLPGYTDDFRVEFETVIHSSFQQLRVDTMILEPAEDPNFNGDSIVAGEDFIDWQRGFGTAGAEITFTGPDSTEPVIDYVTTSDGDSNFDYAVDGDDLVIWSEQYGTTVANPLDTTIPEPAGMVLVIAGLIGIVGFRRS